MSDLEQIRVTAGEFFAIAERNTPIELIGGEIIVSPSPVDAHQVSVMKMSIYLHTHAPKGQVRIAPLDVQFDDYDVLQPDVFWVSDTNSQCVLIDGHWHGAPDLVIEVLSPSTASRDYREKYDIYETHGVREYWIADCVAQYIEVFSLVDGVYQRLGVFHLDDNFISPVLGKLKVQINDLF